MIANQLDDSSPLSHLSFFKNFEHFSYLNRYPYAARCELLERLYALEVQRPENTACFAERVAHFREVLTDVTGAGLTADDAPRLVETLRHIYSVEQLALLTALGTDELLQDVVTIKNRSVLDEVLQLDGGAILVTPHSGPHLALQIVLNQLGFPFVTGGGIADVISQGTPVICRLRDAVPLPLLVFDDTFKTRLREMLAQKYSLSIYPEYSRSARRGGLLTDFLGIQVHAPTGTARLGHEFQRRLVGAAFKRTAPFRFEIAFGPVWTVADEGQAEPVTLDIFRWVEGLITADPCSWEGWNWMENMVVNALHIQRAHKAVP